MLELACNWRVGSGRLVCPGKLACSQGCWRPETAPLSLCPAQPPSLPITVQFPDLCVHGIRQCVLSLTGCLRSLHSVRCLSGESRGPAVTAPRAGWFCEGCPIQVLARVLWCAVRVCVLVHTGTVELLPCRRRGLSVEIVRLHVL